MKTIKQLCKGVKILQIVGNEEVNIENITQNSQEITTGTLFFAIKGANRDGHTFIPEAIEKKARVIVCQQLPEILPKEVTFLKVADSTIAMAQIAANYFDHPSQKLKLVGVTGTNGKTTIATLLYHLFRNTKHKVGLISTIAIYINEQKIDTKNTTPDVITLNRRMHQMVEEGVTHCFMEVSSHGIAMHRIEGLSFAGGIFTNLTQDHLDFHKTFAEYRNTKKKFFDTLKKDAFALTNIDDKNGNFMLQNTQAHKYNYALRTYADFKANILENAFSGLVLRIGQQEIWTHLIGQFNAYNLLAIYATAVLLGMDKEEVAKQISELKPVSGRFQYFISAGNITVIVDYAHTPDALQNVLETIKSIKAPSQHLLTLVGCGGNRDKGKRPIMANIATTMSDKVIFTSDNPREEDPQTILKEMEIGVNPDHQSKYMTITDRRQAIKVACNLAHAGDIILLAGKGHETYQEVKGHRSHFDDLEEAKLIMKSE